VAEVNRVSERKSSIWIARNVERLRGMWNASCGISWATNSGRGFVSTVGRDEEMVRAYIRDQEMADRLLDQLQLMLASS
jgi:REP-associated tyrosine transposase